MKEIDDNAEREDSERFARGLLIGVRVAIAALLGAFAAYASGWLAPLVPFDRLPRLLTLPVGEYLRRSGMPIGWDWLRFGIAENWLTASMALLLSVSTLCLVSLAVGYGRRRDWPFLIITLAQIAVLVTAATGVISLGLKLRFWV
jgi:hypothetical protein